MSKRRKPWPAAVASPIRLQNNLLAARIDDQIRISSDCLGKANVKVLLVTAEQFWSAVTVFLVIHTG
jgi:hypothetical protein